MRVPQSGITLARLAVATLAVASPLAAQRSTTTAPWSVTLTPAMNPLPIGFCGAVYVTLKDSTGKDAPRTPAGWRVSIADFDMTVASTNPIAVVGEYNGASNWSVCACQAASIGTPVTITATYPAKGLAAKSRVPGVAFQSSVPLALAAPKGPSNPASCTALKNPTSTVVAGQPVSGPIASARGAPTGGAPVGGAPVSVAPLTVPTGVAKGGGAPLRAAPPTAKAPAGVPITSSPARPAPSFAVNAKFILYEPMEAEMRWIAVDSAIRYSVFRSDGVSQSVDVLPANFTGTAFTEYAPDYRVTYTYTLVAYFADGTSVQSGPVSYRSRALLNPTGFGATDNFDGSVDLAWDVEHGRGDIGYRVDGPGIPTTGLSVPRPTQLTVTGLPTRTSTKILNVPPGKATWRIVALYNGGAYDTTIATFTTLAYVLPKHPTPWLSKNNGQGGLAQHVAHTLPYVAAGPPMYETDIKAVANVSTFRSWINGTPPAGSPLGQWANEAVYGNSGDLGVGRRTDCFQEVKGPPTPGLRTVCYAAAHGIAPGKPGFNDPAVITAPGFGQKPGFILAMMIIKDPIGTKFLVFNAVNAVSATIARTASLDTEGPKFVPYACISCHGGKVNTTTNYVDGAQFLPLDPQLLAFANPTVQSQQEEKIRQLNVMMLNSDPTSAVSVYIRGLYKGTHNTAGTVAKPDFIPMGWNQNQGFYRQVVRPYCVMCHLAAPSHLNFSNEANFQAVLPLIFAAVCKGHTMPHSELQYKEFWLKQTGIMNIPGLLAVTTGNQSCS